jgi:hypothetical protein
MPTGSPRRTVLSLCLAFAILVALSVSIKSAIWQLHPQVFSDSPGYLVPAVSLLDGRGYGAQENGFRSPTYPLLLALVLAPFDHPHLSECQDAHRPVCIDRAAKTADGEFALRMIVLSQILLGLITTTLLFALGWKLTRNTLVAFLFGAGYALNLATAFWEISILTETLTTLLVTLVVYLTLRADRQTVAARVVLGAALGALALCHLLFLGFWIVPTVFIFLRERSAGLRHASVRVAPVLLLPFSFLLAWSAYNYFVNGVFSPSTLTGYVLSQMVAPVIENAPQGYDDITEIYVGYRNALTAETGSYSGAIFRAWQDMMNASGMTFAQLSQKLTTLSLYLIIAYPASYLTVAQNGWEKFWEFSVYHYDPFPAGTPAWALWFIDGAWQRILTILFWLAPLPVAIIFAARRLIKRLSVVRIPFASILLVITSVWFAALVVTLTTFGDNIRYRSYVLPMQYASIILVIWASWRTVSELVNIKSVIVD